MTTVVTEVPTALKKLVPLVMRSFYTVEHVILMDMLIRNPCMKEEDLVELLKFERKQLRYVIAQLKNQRFVKVRLRMETGADGKATRHNYYYINYKIFVNVLKYKLDHMRRKIETEEKVSTSRTYFKCTACEKTFSDLEANQIIYFATGKLVCSFCDSPFVEDETALSNTDSRLILARFNEQTEPLYNLLREVDHIKFAPEILDPEPTVMTEIIKDASGNKVDNKLHLNPSMENHATWSGDATRNKSYDFGNSQGITINFGSSSVKELQEKKEQAIWMVQSTIKAEPKDVSECTWGKDRISNTVINITSSANTKQDDIMEALPAHEKKGAETDKIVIPGFYNNEESSSASEDSAKIIQPFMEPVTEVEEMESDEEDYLMVAVGDQTYALNEVTEELVTRMMPEEKETYIRLTQDL